MRGLRPPRYPELFEACANAILFQQVSLDAASAMTAACVGEKLGAQRGMLYFCLLLGRIEARGEIGRASDVAS